MTTAPSNFEPGLIGHVAALLLGEPNARHSKPDDARYGTNGSLSVDLANNTFFDHEAHEGGGLLDFIVRSGSAKDRREAGVWLDKSALTHAALMTVSQPATPPTTAPQRQQQCLSRRTG